MKRSINMLKALCLAALVAGGASAANAAGTTDTSVKQERNHIRSGNKHYNAKRYAEAEVEYRKALQANQHSVVGQYNLALALIRQAGGNNAKDSKDNSKDNPAVQAAQLLMNVVKATDNNKPLQSRALYNLGNIAYGSKQYKEAIEYYKNALRRVPSDDDARYNLRKAQLKLKEQQNQNNQNKNKNDKNKDKNKDKDKDKQKQNQQDQNKQNQQNQNQQQQQQQQQQGGMSQQNVDQILKAMQDEERATQQRMNAARQQMQRGERERTRNKW